MKHSIDTSVQMEAEKASTPKLSLSSSFPSFTRRRQSTLGLPATPPPMQLQGAIPFQWEEKPGRPRKQLQPGPMQISDSKQEPSSLRLPPRLASTNKMMMLSSPTSVIEGPYRRSVSVRRLASLSFGKKKKKKVTMVRLDRSPTSTEEEEEEEEPTPKSFASSYHSFNLSFKSCSSVSSSICSFHSYGSGESGGTTEEEGEEEEEREVRILRCMRRRSLVTCVTSYTDSLLRVHYLLFYQTVIFLNEIGQRRHDPPSLSHTNLVCNLLVFRYKA